MTNESVTTENDGRNNAGRLAYSTPIDADTIKVTFNGTEYTCEKITLDEISYGAQFDQATETHDWSEYPFAIYPNTEENANFVVTETAGTYQVKIEALEETVETSECFEKAVKAVTSNTEPLIVEVDTSQSIWRVSASSADQDVSWQGIHDEYVKGRTILFQEISMGLPALKKDKFGNVVNVIGDVDSENYSIYVYVDGELRRFRASTPSGYADYSSIE